MSPQTNPITSIPVFLTADSCSPEIAPHTSMSAPRSERALALAEGTAPENFDAPPSLEEELDIPEGQEPLDGDLE